jgi:ketosteroid isomerase-like protein
VKSQNDEPRILKLFEDGDRALMAADIPALSRIFADDYVQYDETGKSFTRQEVIDNLNSGSIRYLSITSTGRRIRFVSDHVAIVHGSEQDDVEQGGQRFPVEYIYMDVVIKREGHWQIVGSQLAKLKED